MIIKKFKPCDKQFDDGLVLKTQTPLKISPYCEQQIAMPFNIISLPKQSIATIHLSQYLKSLGVIIYPTLVSKSTQVFKITLKNLNNKSVQIKAESQLGYLICVSYEPIRTVFNSFRLSHQNSVIKCYIESTLQIEAHRSVILKSFEQINMNQLVFTGVDEKKIKTYLSNDKIIVCNNNDKSILLQKQSFVGYFITKCGLNIQFIQ